MNEAVPAIDSREGFQRAVLWGMTTALASGARRITCVDADFDAWPLDEPAWLEPMAAWLRLPMRQLVLLAARYDSVPRRHPRFTAWRRDWGHAVQTLQAPAEMADNLPTLLFDDRRTCVQLIDAVHWRGRAGVDARTRLQWHDTVDVVLQRSEPAFAATTLGL
ncbi:MAG: hypothetical protein LH480_13150 [Rubrivivax sp.]|nr:hypothetical protein [Rubrivivax sp.]